MMQSKKLFDNVTAEEAVTITTVLDQIFGPHRVDEIFRLRPAIEIHGLYERRETITDRIASIMTHSGSPANQRWHEYGLQMIADAPRIVLISAEHCQANLRSLSDLLPDIQHRQTFLTTHPSILCFDPVLFCEFAHFGGAVAKYANEPDHCWEDAARHCGWDLHHQQPHAVLPRRDVVSTEVQPAVAVHPDEQVSTLDLQRLLSTVPVDLAHTILWMRAYGRRYQKTQNLEFLKDLRKLQGMGWTDESIGALLRSKPSTLPRGDLQIIASLQTFLQQECGLVQSQAVALLAVKTRWYGQAVKLLAQKLQRANGRGDSIPQRRRLLDLAPDVLSLGLKDIETRSEELIRCGIDPCEYPQALLLESPSVNDLAKFRRASSRPLVSAAPVARASIPIATPPPPNSIPAQAQVTPPVPQQIADVAIETPPPQAVTEPPPPEPPPPIHKKSHLDVLIEYGWEREDAEQHLKHFPILEIVPPSPFEASVRSFHQHLGLFGKPFTDALTVALQNLDEAKRRICTRWNIEYPPDPSMRLESPDAQECIRSVYDIVILGPSEGGAETTVSDSIRALQHYGLNPKETFLTFPELLFNDCRALRNAHRLCRIYKIPSSVMGINIAESKPTHRDARCLLFEKFEVISQILNEQRRVLSLVPVEGESAECVDASLNWTLAFTPIPLLKRRMSAISSLSSNASKRHVITSIHVPSDAAFASVINEYRV